MAVEEREEMRYYVFIVYGLRGKWSIPEKEEIMARTVGIGIQNFSKIIERNCFYVDKTSFLKEWWESEDEVTLITRPRRFGKTLTMSMTEQFFSVKYAGRGDLFEGLSIWQEEKYRALQGTYPVISLSFANVKDANYQDARRKICQLIASEFARNSFLLEGKLLSEMEKEAFRRKTIDMEDVDATMALNQLSEYLYRYYGKKVIILLDEYDTPMQEAYVDGYWQELAAFTRSMFHASFKTNQWLERAVMTGITRVSKESIFSDLNNLKVVTTTSDEYGTAFGFTEEEVFAALDEYGMGDRKQEVKQWYDGFIFGKWKDIYNPWSILNYLDTGKLKTYWADTSSNSLVGKLIREGSPDVKMTMEDLLHDRIFHTVIDEQIVFNQLGRRTSAVWSLLLASGYLRVDLADRYVITSNRESGFGRYDVMLEPLHEKDDAMILEFKVHSPEDEKTLQDTADEALRQIEEKKYAEALMAKGIPQERIRKYGFAFAGKEVLIDTVAALV